MILDSRCFSSSNSFYDDSIKQNSCKRILSVTFPKTWLISVSKILAWFEFAKDHFKNVCKTKMNFPSLVLKMLLWKGFGKPNLFVKALLFKMRIDLFNSVSKLVLFDETKGKATFCFQKLNQVFKIICFELSLENILLLPNTAGHRFSNSDRSKAMVKQNLV